MGSIPLFERSSVCYLLSGLSNISVHIAYKVFGWPHLVVSYYSHLTSSRQLSVCLWPASDTQGLSPTDNLFTWCHTVRFFMLAIIILPFIPVFLPARSLRSAVRDKASAIRNQGEFIRSKSRDTRGGFCWTLCILSACSKPRATLRLRA